MVRFKWILLTVISGLMLLPSVLQAQLRLEGEFRPRSEYRNGYRLMRTADTEPAFFTSQRSRLVMDYESGNYRFRLSGQDVRVWGEVPQLQDNASVNIHEAWALLDVSDSWQVKAGRQELVYDDQRLLGSVNWTQQGRSHDALLLQYRDRKSEFKLDLGGAYNQESAKLLGNSYALNNYKVLTYLWMNKQLGDLKGSLLLLSDGFEAGDGSTVFRYTYGTHLLYKEEPWSLTASGYLQSGDDNFRRDISAHMFAGSIAYKFDNISLKAGYSYLSGGGADDANPARHAFHTLYATNHKFYGNMDYFLNVPADTDNGGLQDLHLGATFSLGNNMTLGMDLHRFALASRIAGSAIDGQSPDRYLGTELDLSYSWQPSDEIGFRLGYSALGGSSTLDLIQSRDGADLQHWGWAMLQLTPTFLSSEQEMDGR